MRVLSGLAAGTLAIGCRRPISSRSDRLTSRQQALGMSWISKVLQGTGLDAQSRHTSGQNRVLCNRERIDMVVIGDNPIRRIEDDKLGRAVSARNFAQQVLALDVREGVVVGVLGSWGSGKTSFVNLARDEFEKAGVALLDFNPWMFSGAEQLVESFFVELAAQLKIRSGFAEVGRNLEEYGETFSGMAWLPLVGPWIERGRGATKILGKILQRRKEGIGQRRAKLEKALTCLTKPIVVVLDDVDRLSTSEIRDVFKLVRLTASFPHIIYIMAFDRFRVEKALAEQGVLGRDYLEKILQVVFDLPAIPNSVLNQQILSAVEGALATIKTPGQFNDDVGLDVFMEIIRPLIRNMRDVRRYATAIQMSVGSLKGQIALVDVLALEAVRVFLPEVFGHLNGAVAGLTTTIELSAGVGADQPQLKAQIDTLVESAESHGEVVRAMIGRLFPAGQRHIGGSSYGGDWKGQWLRERRVAHEDILRLYLERVAGEGLQVFTEAEQAWARMADREALETYLCSLHADRLQDVIASLGAYEEKFAPEHVVPGSIVLLNLLPDLPERKRGMFEFDTPVVVRRVVYRLIRSLGNPAAVEAAVRQILPEVKSLSAKLALIRIIGYRKGMGHKLVSELAAAEYEKTLRDEIRARTVDQLAKEQDLVRLFLAAKSEADPSEPPLIIYDAPELTLGVLRASRTEVSSMTEGSRAVRRSSRLAWDVLIELYGDEVTLKERIENLKATGPKGDDKLLELADKYLAGWRPKEWDDD